jgi:hypothetical protein
MDAGVPGVQHEADVCPGRLKEPRDRCADVFEVHTSSLSSQRSTKSISRHLCTERQRLKSDRLLGGDFVFRLKLIDDILDHEHFKMLSFG